MSLRVMTQGGGTGGATASIFVTGLDENSTVTAAKDGKTVKGKWVQKPLIPKAYTELEYIKSTGAQYIDTLLQTTGSLRFWIDFSVENEISANDIGTVFGMRSSGIWEEIYDYALNTYPNFSGGTFQVGRVSVPSENVSADPKIVPNQRCQISYLGNTFTAADGTTTELAPQSFNASYTLFLFAKHIVNDVGEFGRVTLYRAKFYDGSALVRDFIPSRRNADGVVGLYDTVNGVFYTDGRNGTFVAGAEKSGPTEVCPECIKSDADYLLYTYGTRNYKKAYAGDAYCCTVVVDGWLMALMASKTASAVAIYTDGDHSSGVMESNLTVTFRGETWYVSGDGAAFQATEPTTSNVIHFGTFATREEAALAFLEYAMPQPVAGFEIAPIKEYGMYTVTATNGEKTETQDVLVDAAVEYEIEMSYVLWLYREGDECEDITGGWVLENGGGGSLTKNADHMVLYHNYNTSAVYTKNTAISNPKYRTFCAEIKAEQSPFNQKNFVSQYSSSSSLYSEITSTSYYKQTIDISSTVGSPFYVRFYGQYWGATSSGRIYIKNVWLE